MPLLGPLIRNNGKFLLLDIQLRSPSRVTGRKTQSLLKFQKSGPLSRWLSCSRSRVSANTLRPSSCYLKWHQPTPLVWGCDLNRWSSFALRITARWDSASAHSSQIWLTHTFKGRKENSRDFKNSHKDAPESCTLVNEALHAGLGCEHVLLQGKTKNNNSQTTEIPFLK